MEDTKTLIVLVTLKGENYLLWARTKKTALCGRGLWTHITSSEAPKEELVKDGKYVVTSGEEKWFQEDQSVLAIIQNSLDAPILEAYSYCEMAKDLWDTLQNVFDNTTNLNRVFEIKRAINSLSQEDMEFTKHFGKFRSLWAKLEMLRPATLDPAILNERREQDKVFGLLLTLNPSYNDLIKHILRSDKLPSLDDVCNQIQKEHGSMGLFGSKGELATANKVEIASANKSYFKHDDKNPPVCDHCKKVGHFKSRCWILHHHLQVNRPMNNRGGLPRAHQATMVGEATTLDSNHQVFGGNGVALAASSELVRRSDLDALIKALKEASGY